MRLIKHKIFLIFIIFLQFLVIGCSGSNEVFEKRLKIAEDAEKIKIGVAWSFSTNQTKVYEGVKLAAEEINETGGVLGKKIVIEKRDDAADVNQGLKVAEQFASDPDVMAVIGHKESYVTDSVSLIYETAKLIAFSPKSTNPKISKKGYQYFFRNVPTDIEIGQYMANVANDKGYRRVIICYADNLYGLGLANAFEKEASLRGLEVVNRSSYSIGDRGEFKYILGNWELYNFDAIFFAGTLPAGGYFVSEAREADYQQPILAGNGLDSTELIEIADEAADNVMVSTEFNPELGKEKVKNFERNFEKKYNIAPDTSAALGYDALQVIVEAMRQAKSVAPQKVAPQLREIEGWSGVTGKHTFAENGDVVNKNIYLKVVKDGKFEFSNLNQSLLRGK
ncbi:MAG: ABC transporter substrate-binding protein [Bacillota bacterium]